MCEVLSLGKKSATTTPTATVSKPPNPNTNDFDFLDFIPIDNNIDDFDLTSILKDIADKDQDSKTNEQDTTLPKNPDINKAMIPQNMQIASAKSENTANNSELAVTPPQITNKVTNKSTTQNAPFIPRISITHSNVTINYNFNK